MNAKKNEKILLLLLGGYVALKVLTGAWPIESWGVKKKDTP